jgi:hypothetical protein
MGAHVGPSSLTLLLNSTLGSLSAKIVRDNRASVLHVEEVGSEGTLGGVGVNGSLLALLLLLNRGSKLRDGHDELLSSMLKGGQEVILGALSSGLTEEKVGLSNIVGSEGAEKLQNGGETTNSLYHHVSLTISDR